MKKWFERVSRAVVMGLAWAAAWIPVGVLAGLVIVGEAEPEHIGGPLYAGFLCGALFAAVAGIAAGRRRLDELSVAQAGARGAVSGLLVGVLPFVLGGNLSGGPSPWLDAGIIGGLTLLSAMTAVGSVLLARMAKKGRTLDTKANAR
jgi:hypothetical protein